MNGIPRPLELSLSLRPFSMALVNVVVSVGGERELLARAGKNDAEASRGMRGRSREA